MVDNDRLEQALEHFIQAYYAKREAEMDNLKSLPGRIMKTRINLENYPAAKSFLDEQKELWHPLALKRLKPRIDKEAKYNKLISKDSGSKLKDNPKHFLYAKEFFLELAPDPYLPLDIQVKQQNLIHVLENWYENTLPIVVGVSAVTALLRNQQPLVIMDLNQADNLGPGRLESSLEDERFIQDYRLMTEMKYNNYAGLYRYLIKPVENDYSDVFYSGVSDFMLCVLDGIKDLEINLKDERMMRIS